MRAKNKDAAMMLSIHTCMRYHTTLHHTTPHHTYSIHAILPCALSKTHGIPFLPFKATLQVSHFPPKIKPNTRRNKQRDAGKEENENENKSKESKEKHARIKTMRYRRIRNHRTNDSIHRSTRPRPPNRIFPMIEIRFTQRTFLFVKLPKLTRIRIEVICFY